MLSKTSHQDVAKDKVSETVSAVADAARTGRAKIAPVVETAAERLSDAADTAAAAAEPRVGKATKSAKKSAKKQAKAATKAAKKAAKKARSAGDQAYAALPDQARSTVETVVPEVATQRRSKGKLLIALGLIAGAGAVALLVSDKKKAGGQQSTTTDLPKVERRDAAAAEETESVAVSGSDDAVGDAEQQLDAAVSDSRRGRHAAQE